MSSLFRQLAAVSYQLSCVYFMLFSVGIELSVVVCCLFVMYLFAVMEIVLFVVLLDFLPDFTRLLGPTAVVIWIIRPLVWFLSP